MEELVATLVPGGAYLVVGVTLGAIFGKQLRPVAKQAVKLGLNLAARAEEAAAEAYERGQDLVAEARYEHEHEVASGNGSTPKPRPARRRSTAKASS